MTLKSEQWYWRRPLVAVALFITTLALPGLPSDCGTVFYLAVIGWGVHLEFRRRESAQGSHCQSDHDS
jgi:hypothetical protein